MEKSVSEVKGGITMKLGYFPGCSLKGMARAYDESTKIVAEGFGIELMEVDDFNCCGALEAKGSNEKLSYMLPARVMDSAKGRFHVDAIVTPCNGCYHSLLRANAAMNEDSAAKSDVISFLKDVGYGTYEGDIDVRHFLELFYNEVGPEKVKNAVKKSLKGLKVASYYGCLYERPKTITKTGYKSKRDDSENPYFQDELLAATGAEVVKFEAAASCCGGAHALQDESLAATLSAAVLSAAKKAGADILALPCPLCGAALDIKQPEIVKAHGNDAKIPVVYFTQLIGLAMGKSAKDLKLTDPISNPMEILKSKGLV
ncbi:MAG: CoB--CoM heterodisulfide reductase iron-sulfur subunit B family protein [Deltaproteobacteria bacterium]|uniref:Disulfide reductase n=1 Tax=Candidatus Acididesulfobacter diazotrophicus TaxID=2597226 RepID=A0A519BM80_9DELT|nr:CoB--CoM heterodisulfide reductase iron-sulfur subunit B family protein [Deltaproteobacteria bacterium]RZD18363.1 MAG: disulfide reductase [Candidatus Acididesulfobacter diazotrophicus]